MAFSSLSRLRARLAFIIAVALTPAGVLAVVQAVNAISIVSEQETKLLETLALSAIDDERALLIEIRQVVRATAKGSERALETGENCLPRLTQLQAEYGWISDLYLLDESGRATCGTAEGLDVGDLPGWAAFNVLPSYTLAAMPAQRAGEERRLMAYYPIDAPAGGPVALGVSIDTGRFASIAALSENNLDVALLDRNGEIVTASDADDATWLPADRSALKVFGDRRLSDVDASGHERSYFVSALVGGQLWAVMNNRPPALTGSLISFAGLSVLAPIAIWLIAVIVAYFAIDLLVARHIASLRRAALRIGEGDLDTPVDDYREAPAEIKALGGSIRAMRDKIADREAALTKTLELQRRLLLEIHHRVKNNLQTISSLMNLESDRISSPEASDVIGNIQARVYSLAMVHQNLYAAENLEEVALDQLTRDIASHLEESLSRQGEAGITSMELEPLVAPTNLATPISLFLSEALGNAFKHAGAPADIRLSLKNEDDTYVIAVSNRKSEHSDDVDKGGSGLGLELMRGFAKQIGGRFESGPVGAHRFEVTLSVPRVEANELFTVRRA